MQLRELGSGEKGINTMKAGAVILVAVKLTAECREMLTWIVAKLAQPGDQVVAMHFVRAFTDSGDDILDPTTKKKLDSTFESVLGVYQSICNLKQVRLDIKVVSGLCLRKSLIEAAIVEKASKLVLGGTRNASESLAKYCAKHMYAGCFVLIVEHGQVVFAKEGLHKFSAKKGRFTNRSSVAAAPETPCRSDRADSYKLQPVQPSGWPLMHRSISIEKPTTPRSLSVVKWALQLPDRLKIAFDKQNGTGVRLVGSSDQMRHHNVPRLNCSDKNQSHAIVEARPSAAYASELKSHQVSFFQKVAHLCRNKSCIRFTYSDLEEATSNFASENLVGKGGCSKVYRGLLSDGREVAVKCLKGAVAEADGELLTEVEILTSLKHPHIITLLGYYADTQTHILVYNFASEGSLEENLHGGKGKNVLSWRARRNIAAGAAEALVYLHDACARPVIHRDVKSSNILLSSSLSAQISDFGLAKWAPTSSTHITCTDVVGTLGYLAPEYFMFGRVSDKTDVYAFGVVLLEIITGRPPIDMSKPKGEENLVAWAGPFLDCGNKEELVDPKLEGDYDENELMNLIVAAKSCLRQSPQHRPRMARVLRMIRGDDASPSGRHEFADEYATEFVPESESNDIRKHLALAMLGVDDDVASQSSADQELAQSGKNLKEYLGGRWSRSSSLDS